MTEQQSVGKDEQPEDAVATPGISRRGRRAFVIGVIGFVIIVVMVPIRYLVFQAADQPTSIPAPERQGLNAPFIKSPDLVVDKMVELAELDEDDLVYDLGCGDGRIVITASLKSGCRGVGFDIDPERVAEANENVRLHEVEDRVTIEEKDVFTVDLREADAAVMYLLPWMMDKLRPQFEQMKPGCRIVSHEFRINGVEPDRVIEVRTDEYSEVQRIILYTTPLKDNPNVQR